MLQRLTFQILHGNKRFAVFFSDIVNRADAGMIQRGGRLCFPLETCERLWIAGYIVGQKFQCDETMQARVFGLVHHTHAPAA